MAFYRYVKGQSKKGFGFGKKLVGKKKEFSFFFTIAGLVLVGNAIIPIISYQLRYASRFDRILSPLVAEKKELIRVAGASAKELEEDYTLVSSWFEEKPHFKSVSGEMTDNYYLTVPKLGIEKAKVVVGGEDLKRTLIHYLDTAFPGQFGNSVIIGHSVLPQFFNPENYLTIFSTLHRLREGDEILVEFDGTRYRYLVEKLFEVPAKDLTVLEQRYDGRYLTLITCSPPGTYLRRLIVRAQLID